VQEALEALHLREPLEQRAPLFGRRGRAEGAVLGDGVQPGALGEVLDVVVVVADGAGVDLAQVPASGPAVGQTMVAGSAASTASSSPCVAGSSIGSPGGGAPSGSIRAARWPNSRMLRASRAAPTTRATSSPAMAGRAAGAGAGAGGVNWSKKARVSVSTELGSCW
jgi:hypothetical protein